MNCLTGSTDENTAVLQNVKNCLPIDTALHPRRLEGYVGELLSDPLFSFIITLYSCYLCLLLSSCHFRGTVEVQVTSSTRLQIVWWLEEMFFINTACMIIQTSHPYATFINMQFVFLISGCVVSSAYLAIEPAAVQDGFYDSQR
jgi:hypothetical protein